MNEKLKLTRREVSEIAFALNYHDNYAHGSDGHSRLMIIAKLARLAGFMPLPLNHSVAVPPSVEVTEGSKNGQ